MSAQTSLAASLAPPAARTIAVRLPTATLPPAPSSGRSPLGGPESGRLYGPPGWTVRIGLWHLLEPWLDTLRLLPDERPLTDESALFTDAVGAPTSDYVPFRGMDAVTAAELLPRLPTPALADRQNLSPTLKTMLTACARADGRVRLSGYGIGPQRDDERLSAEALWVADPDLQGYEVFAEHSRACQCSALWERVKERYELDAHCIPDDIVRTRPEWAGGGVGWWMWWD